MTIKPSILVIDDDFDICEFVSATAEAVGLNCLATTQIPEFLQALTPETALILLDLVMPETDGVELLRLLGEQQCKTGIVLISGVGRRIMETAEEMANELGLRVVGHLEKPFRMTELEAMLKKQTLPDGAAKIHTHTRASAQAKIAMTDVELQNAILNQEFILYYQPQIDIKSGAVKGVEGLVRWQHPMHGIVFPDDFIPRMEQIGLIDPLGWIVLMRGLTDLKQLMEKGGSNLRLSLNVSVSSLHDLRFPDKMAALIRESGVKSNQVILEITESGLIKELARTLDVLTRLRLKGVQLSIDDFGTGYSMMQQLNHIPATELKIDKSFVQNMSETDRDRVMVAKTIEIGHELGMKVVAEGVETATQLEFLRLNGCDIAQGYYVSKPLPLPEFLDWVEKYRAGRESE
jgi:EAL domain-containing protein (putative c-di-GMP-specific phosphodiesterase class I)/FixJ family two-component response regulator